MIRNTDNCDPETSLLRKTINSQCLKIFFFQAFYFFLILVFADFDIEIREDDQVLTEARLFYVKGKCCVQLN